MGIVYTRQDKELIKVKAFCYDPVRGLLLIQTEKSAKDGKFTVPGGSVGLNKGKIQSLEELTAKETGLNVNNVWLDPFFVLKRDFERKRSFDVHESVEVYSYWVSLDLSPLNGDSFGKLPSGNRYVMFSRPYHDQLIALQMRLTKDVWNIVHTLPFIEGVRKADRNYFKPAKKE